MITEKDFEIFTNETKEKFKKVKTLLEPLVELESNLGCDILIVFKALTKGIRIKDYNFTVGVSLNTRNYDCEYMLETYDGKERVLTRDYGKTWILPEEVKTDD